MAHASVLDVNGKAYRYFSCDSLPGAEKMPYTLRILIENVLRNASSDEAAQRFAQRIVDAGLAGVQGGEIEYQVKLPSGIANALLSLVPMLVLAALMIFFFVQFSKANNSQMSFGRAKAKKTVEERPDVRFSDVAGEDEAVEELLVFARIHQEVLDLLKLLDRLVLAGDVGETHVGARTRLLQA